MRVQPIGHSARDSAGWTYLRLRAVTLGWVHNNSRAMTTTLAIVKMLEFQLGGPVQPPTFTTSLGIHPPAAFAQPTYDQPTSSCWGIGLSMGL
jgi:hypothetical protein